MKEIKAVIQPHMLERVLHALQSLPHFSGATVSDCRGHGRGGGAGEKPPGEDLFYLAPKIKLEIFCGDADAEKLVTTIATAARTGNPGDGIIIVVEAPLVVRVRTGERQELAV
ncbi:MAG TPA: P-II family nitrogen regulator [Lacipirellulaceae bacterium]|nr:P-II family nitrogen regulator [Lacipirellulaceae bacterium]